MFRKPSFTRHSIMILLAMNTAACLLATDVSHSGTPSARCANTPGTIDTSDMTKNVILQLLHDAAHGPLSATYGTKRVQSKTLSMNYCTCRQWPQSRVFTIGKLSVNKWSSWIQLDYVSPFFVCLGISHTHKSHTHAPYKLIQPPHVLDGKALLLWNYA